MVFTTAYEKYAVAAFRFSAIDFLLKPVDKDELIGSVTRAIDSVETSERAAKYDALFNNLKGGTQKLCLPSVNGLDFVSIDDIVRCQSNGNYTVFFLKGGQKLTVAKTLKEYDALLGQHNFFRVHHSHLVNLNLVTKYSKGKGGYITMVDKSEIEVSTRRRDAFLERVSQ